MYKDVSIPYRISTVGSRAWERWGYGNRRFQSPIVYLQSGHKMRKKLKGFSLNTKFQSPIVYLQSGHLGGMRAEEYGWIPFVSIPYRISTVGSLDDLSVNDKNKEFQSPIVYLQSGHDKEGYPYKG